MNGKLTQISGLMEILERGGIWNANELSNELSVSTDSIRHLVRRARDKFSNGDKEINYIYTTKGGYTIEEHPENVAYEARLRMRQGVGILMNGTFVFKRCRRVALKGFRSLAIEYKPKMLEVRRIIK